MLIELENELRARDVLMTCRRSADAYAYMRLVAWESGGGLTTTGRAQCVAGLSGQPLAPVSVRTFRSDCANGCHALFTSRDGLLVAEAVRHEDIYDLEIRRCHIERNVVKSEQLLLQSTIESRPGQPARNRLLKMDLANDPYLPLMRAVLRKVDCQYCVHCHYRAVEEDS